MSDMIEGFLVDQAFTDRAKAVHGILSQDANQICSFTPHGTTYFNTPVKMTDPVNATDRKVAWTPSTKSTLLVDTTTFPAFSTLFQTMSSDQMSAFFRIIDRLAFRNDPAASIGAIDSELSTDTTLNVFYVAQSCARSGNFTPVNVWLDNETTQKISVPNFIQFDFALTIGAQQVVTSIIIYLNCDAFTQNYSKSTVKTVVAPLPYATLLSAPVKGSIGNVFATATLTAGLAYQTQQPDMALNTMSGICTFSVTLIDGMDSAEVPFNLLYKGKQPTVSQIRDAIRTALLTSGTGTEDDWRNRAPGLFIIARFYLFPLWDKTVTRPTTILRQNILQFRDIISLNKTAMLAAGLNVDIATEATFQSGYNGLMVLAVPDSSYVPMDQSLTGSKYLLDYFPDFQTCTSVEPIYALLTQNTQILIKRLNDILAKADGVATVDTTPVMQEGVISYYGITVGDLEMCVITKECYTKLIKDVI